MKSELTFTYYPDPEIQDITPTTQLARCVVVQFKSIHISFI